MAASNYSPVEGTTANQRPDQVPDAVKQERFDRFMQLQQQISAEHLQKKIGHEILVIVDEVDEEGAVGRNMADAPEDRRRHLFQRRPSG